MTSPTRFFLRLFQEYRHTVDALNETQAAYEKQSGCYGTLSAVKSDLQRAESNYQRVLSGNAQLEVERGHLRTQLAGLESDLESIRNANEELATEKLLLQDRLESALEDKQRLWDQFQESLKGERYALQTMVNHATQKSAGGIPFPEANALPVEVVRKPQVSGPVGRRGRMLSSQAVEQESRRFVENFFKDQTPGNGPV